MKYFLFIIFLVYPTVEMAKIPTKFDDVSNLSNKLFLSVLDQTIKIKSDSYKKLPPSISFFSADTKFDGKHLKFCEVGNGLYGVIYPVYGLLEEKKAILYPPYWEFLWIFACKFNIPIWCIRHDYARIAEQTLHALGGEIFDNIESFENYLSINYPQEKLITEKPKSIESHVGILAYGGPRIENYKLEAFKAAHPGILFINDFPWLYQRRKDKIHEVFNDDFLKQFRPAWGIYPTQYSETLLKQIKNEIKSPLYIIKPLVGRQSRGIILVDEKNLDLTLKTIFKKTPRHKNKKKKMAKFDWETYEYDKFIIEEFITSKQIIKNGKPYDPTLRLGFIIIQNNGKISINVINAFWKFPPKSLTDNCELTEKHVTKSLIGIKEPALNADTQDLKQIRTILNNMLPKLYEKLLTFKN
jgi:hypothetical protein